MNCRWSINIRLMSECCSSVSAARVARSYPAVPAVVAPGAAGTPNATSPHSAKRHLTELERLGLYIEPFGPTSFLIRSLPVMLGHPDLAALVQDLVEDLEQWASLSSP